METTAIEKADNSLPFMLFDQLDDDLIKQELEGKIPEILTYHFDQKGQEIWGISKAGVDEAVRQLARKGEVIRELELTYTETDSDYLFVGKAARYAVNADGREVQLDSKYGIKRQPKQYNNGQANPFAFEQGGMKAMRNASRRLIPKEIEIGVIEYAKQQGKVKEVKYNPNPKKEPEEPRKKPFDPVKMKKDLGLFIFNMEEKDRDRASDALGKITNQKYRSMTHIPDEDLETVYIKAEKYYGMETDSRPEQDSGAF